jgi:hypothetical protein
MAIREAMAITEERQDLHQPTAEVICPVGQVGQLPLEPLPIEDLVQEGVVLLMVLQGAWVPVGAIVPVEAIVPAEVVPEEIIVLEEVVLEEATEVQVVAGRPVHPVAEVDLPEEVDLQVAVVTANQFNIKKIAT